MHKTVRVNKDRRKKAGKMVRYDHTQENINIVDLVYLNISMYQR